MAVVGDKWEAWVGATAATVKGIACRWLEAQ